jgi:glycosyltransferase involved in cell wall biosynthesis
VSPRCFFIAVSWSDSPVSIHFRALAQELAARGHRVVLLVDQQKKEVESHNTNPSVYTWPSKRPTKIADMRFLSQLIRRHRPHCLIGNFSAVNIFSLVGWWHRVPCRVIWYHTLSSQIAQDSKSSHWKIGLQNFRKQWIYKFATHVVANSQASSVDVQQSFRVPAVKCHVTYFSLPDPQITVTKESATLVCVGRLDHSKGQDVLLNAMPQILTEVPQAKLLLIGDGPMRNELLQLAESLGIAQHCSFMGRLPHSEVLQAMASASVTIVPSRAEAFGLVNIESFAVGTPVVASNVGGIPEIYSTPEKEGFLVPPNDSGALAEKIVILLQNHILRADKSALARTRFLEKFDAIRVIPTQADWFESLVANAAGCD